MAAERVYTGAGAMPLARTGDEGEFTAMTQMLCRNKVADFARWKRVFDSHTGAHREAGLTLERLWRGVDDPDEVLFLFSVGDIARARAFVSAPDAGEARRESGVIDGNIWFVEPDEGSGPPTP